MVDFMLEFWLLLFLLLQLLFLWFLWIVVVVVVVVVLWCSLNTDSCGCD